MADPSISIEDAISMVGTVEGYDCCMTLVNKTQSAQGELTSLLYKILKAENTQRETLLKDFLQV